MKLVYFLQTHNNPEQIYRLVNIIKKSSPESLVLISHDYKYSNLDATRLQNFTGVEVLKLSCKGSRGDFSMIQGYLDAFEWLSDHSIDFDWLFNITGQDYLTQPISRIEQFLAETQYDGFLHYFVAVSEEAEWGIKESQERYLYQYWRSGVFLSWWQRALLKPLKSIINNTQTFVRMNWSYDGLMIGVRASLTPFNEKFLCYGGSYFSTISKKCVQYLYDFSKQNVDVVKYYKKTLVPVESFMQTVLVNSGLFRLCNDTKRYMDFSNSRHGHPRTLTVEDYPELVKDDIHFARKFEPTLDSKILDMLDARILQGS